MCIIYLHFACFLHITCMLKRIRFLYVKKIWWMDNIWLYILQFILYITEIIQDISVCPPCSYKLSCYLKKQLNSDRTMKFEASDIIQSRFDSTSSLTSRYLYAQKSIDRRKGVIMYISSNSSAFWTLVCHLNTSTPRRTFYLVFEVLSGDLLWRRQSVSGHVLTINTDLVQYCSHI